MRGSLRSSFLVTVLLGGLLASSPSTAHESLRDRIDEYVRAEQKNQKIPGLAVAVVSHGKVVLAKGYGFANLEHQVRVTPDTIFQSASMGKMFTAMAVMLQVEAGKVSLSDSVTKYFPDAPATWKPITVYHLLTHTSGIRDHEGLLDTRKDYTEQQFVEYLYTLPLDFPAGLRWTYSNSGYVLLSTLVNRITGTHYTNVLGEQVFKPTRMKTARGISEEDIIPNRSAGYRLVNSVVKNQQWVSPTVNVTGDGGLYFSLKDLLAWDTAVDHRAILSGESWRNILSPAKLNSGAPYPYGFGWFIEQRNGAPLQQHTGNWQGFRTAYYRYTSDALSVIVLANLNKARPWDIADGIAAIVNPALAVPPLKPIPDTEPQLTARFARLLEQCRAGTLDPAEFSYVPYTFFPEDVPFYQAMLEGLGPTTGPLILVKREILGDDRAYTYWVQVGSTTLEYRVSLSPDDRVSNWLLLPN